MFTVPDFDIKISTLIKTLFIHLEQLEFVVRLGTLQHNRLVSL